MSLTSMLNREEGLFPVKDKMSNSCEVGAADGEELKHLFNYLHGGGFVFAGVGLVLFKIYCWSVCSPILF